MTLSRSLRSLRHPFVALALCTLLAQQVVGFVLTASPALAIESGFSLCLSDPIDASDDPMAVVEGAGFCACTLSGPLALLPPAMAMPVGTPTETATLPYPTADLVTGTGIIGPPTARAPPLHLHI